MKKVSNLIIAFFSLIALSFLASCSNVNVNSEPSLIIQLPGGNIGKAVSSGDITWFDVSVTNDQNSYSGGGYAGSIVEIERVNAGTYTVTCNGKKNKDDLLSFFTDSKIVEVGIGENVVALALSQKDNGPGYPVWIGNYGGSRSNLKILNFDSDIYNPDKQIEGDFHNFSFDNKGNIYTVIEDSGFNKPYYISDTENKKLSELTVKSIHIDNATNALYNIDGNGGTLTVNKITGGSETCVLQFGGLLTYDHLSTYSLGFGSYTIYNNMLIGCFPGTSNKYYLDVYKFPATSNVLAEKVFSFETDYLFNTDNTPDILVKDGAVYILFNKKTDNYYTGVLLKYTINSDGSLTFAGKLGDEVQYITEYPIYYVEGATTLYLYKKVGSEYKVLTRYKPDEKKALDTTKNSSFFHRPLNFIASPQDYLVIADSTYVYDKNSTGEIIFKRENRIITIDLKKFRIAHIDKISDDGSSSYFIDDMEQNYETIQLSDSLLDSDIFYNIEDEFGKIYDLNNVYYKTNDNEYRLLKDLNDDLKQTVQLCCGLPK